MKYFEQLNIEPHLIEIINPRIGVVALSTDFTIEQDYRLLCHNLPVDIFVNRIPFENPCTYENYLKMSEYLPSVVEQILPNQKINTIAYGCTSGTIAIGKDKIESQIHKSKPEAYITTPISSAIKAFKKLNINKIAVLTPYPRLVNQSVFEYLNKLIEVDTFSSFNLNNDSDIAKVDPMHLINSIKKIDYSNIDAIFVSCTALKILEVLQVAEDIIGIPIISSNQAMIWDSLRSVKIKTSINGFGKLLLN